MYTYYIKAYNIPKDILEKRGNWQEYKEGKNIDFLYVEKSQYAPEKRFYNLDIGIENKLVKEYADKYSLVKSFLKSKVRGEKNLVMNQKFISIHAKEYMIKAYQNFIKKDKIYILKPIKGFAKMGIKIIENQEQFREEYKRIKKEKKYEEYVLQEFIQNPLLYLGKKFHFRCFYILTNQGKAYLYSTFWIFRAKKKYKENNYHEDIHITKYQEGDERIRKKMLVNEDNTGAFSEEEFRKIKKELIKVHKKLKDKFDYKCFTNSKCCFQIFGSDIMFTKDFKPILIEINGSPSFDKKRPMMTTTQKPLMEGIMQEIVDKIYPPLNKVEKNNYLIKL